MRRRRLLGVGFTALAAAVFLAILAGGPGTAPRSALAATPQASPAADQNTPDPNHHTPPVFTIPPELQMTLPPDQPTAPPATAPPAPRQTAPPSDTPLPTTAPVPTGPAVGTEVTPPALVSVPVASIGPRPQGNGSDVTVVILIVIIGLGLLAVGAFVLALAVQ